jgi:hypothetical protein
VTFSFETANETNDRFGPGALIRGFADHTPGAGLNGVPGALSFWTGPAGDCWSILNASVLLPVAT